MDEALADGVDGLDEADAAEVIDNDAANDTTQDTTVGPDIVLFEDVGADADHTIDDGTSTGSDVPTPVPDGATDSDTSGPDLPKGDAPLITAIDPSTASFRGGEALRIEGSGLDKSPAVQIGALVAAVVSSGPDFVTVTVPGTSVGGAATVEVKTSAGTATFEGFVYFGIAPPSLRFVEVPGQIDPVLGDRLVRLRGPGKARLAVLGAGLSLLETGDDGRMTSVWYETEAMAPASAACAADFDADGDDDLWVADTAGMAGVRRHDTGGLAAPTLTPVLPVSDAVCGLLAGDQNPDVLIAVNPPEGLPALRFMQGTGQGTVTEAAGGVTLGSPAAGIAVGDVDGDGRADVLVGRKSGTPRLLLGDGFGGLVDAPAGSTPAGANGARPTLADFTGDGATDAFLLGPSGSHLWVNDGTGHLADHSFLTVGVPGMDVSAVHVVDLDVDGALDIFVVGATASLVLRNDGSGRLFDYSETLLPRVGAGLLRAVAISDLDGDLDPDIAALRGSEEGPVLFRAWDPAPFIDPDLDGIPAELDICPVDYDPKQLNSDIHHFRCPTAAACLAETGCSLSIATWGRAYLVCPNAAVFQAEARAFCEARGSTLAFFDIEAEQQYVVSLNPGRFWMDITDAAVEGSFVSSSGASPSFTMWGAQQPDDAGGTEECVELIPADPAGTIWNDLPCEGHARAIVCEDTVVELSPDPADACDVCPLVHDPDQVDSDGDGVGDACAPVTP